MGSGSTADDIFAGLSSGCGSKIGSSSGIGNGNASGSSSGIGNGRGNASGRGNGRESIVNCVCRPLVAWDGQQEHLKLGNNPTRSIAQGMGMATGGQKAAGLLAPSQRNGCEVPPVNVSDCSLPRPPELITPQDFSDGEAAASGSSPDLLSTLGPDFSPPVLRNTRLRSRALRPIAASSALYRQEALTPGGALRLCYDSVLDCYFDPRTSKYYELSPAVDTESV